MRWLLSRKTGRTILLIVIPSCAAAVLLGIVLPAGRALAQDGSQGQRIYEERCAACHGLDGDGQGPAAERLFIKPRDFTRDEYKIKSTAGDEFPSLEDLKTVIADGIPGSSMPAWRGAMSDSEIAAVAEHIQTFGRFFSQEGFGTTAVEVPRRIGASDESIERGRVLYQEEIECFKCHGLEGRGDGPSAFELTDNAGHVTYPTDLSQRWLFRGGADPEDIYLRLHTGLTGSPMPSFADALSEEDTWHLVNYLLSLGPEEIPEPAVLLVSEYVDGPLPMSLDDPAWEALAPVYYPLAGQIMRPPRHYQPSVNAVWVSSLFNDTDVAFLLSWNDRTETRDGEAVDAIALQFPQELSADGERPYFVFGDATNAVYQLYWSAGTDSAVERNARGLEAVSEQAEDEQQVTASARYRDGRWQVILRRSRQTGGDGDLAFESDRFIPVTLMVWDGFAGESAARMGLSTWSQLHLPSPTALVEYFWVPVVMVVVAAAESFVLWRARRKDPAEESG